MQTYLPDGYPSAGEVASLLDTSERTLFRKLADRGVAYQTLVDNVRFSEAKEMLCSGLPQNEVASYLGFTDAANFSRMFRRIGGLSPRQYRETTKSRTERQEA